MICVFTRDVYQFSHDVRAPLFVIESDVNQYSIIGNITVTAGRNTVTTNVGMNA
jgi:hypothetical protein